MSTITIQSRYQDLIKSTDIEVVYSANRSRIVKYYMNFWHKELELHKELSGRDIPTLQSRVTSLMHQWDARYDAHVLESQRAAGRELAEELTGDAEKQTRMIEGLLDASLKTSNRIIWQSLKLFSKYKSTSEFNRPFPKWIPSDEPVFSRPRISLFDYIFGRREARIAEARLQFAESKSQWERDEQQRGAAYLVEQDAWLAAKAQYEAEEAERAQKFQAAQDAHNLAVDALKAGVESGEAQAVADHTQLVLERSGYGDFFERSINTEYNPDNKMLIVDYQLPNLKDIPNIKTVKFHQATGELKYTYISEKAARTLYDDTCYRICLRSLHELFSADECGNLQSITFNGIANYVNIATGHDTSSCILSVSVRRDDFLAIDLHRVDPRACFKSLKGVSASQLSTLSPIVPILTMSKDDRRFIDSRPVAESMNDHTNLASMDWNDFEHFVREVFERYFISLGGEVKITQSSRDGGVDAIAYNPDPITGGKIVIQAKRYTRTVGVDSVRDLYGTMNHEGASRGVLVTTSDFGPDAYKFATGKPITLLNGANLLSIIEQHGMKAKINIHEARKELNLKS